MYIQVYDNNVLYRAKMTESQAFANLRYACLSSDSGVTL